MAKCFPQFGHNYNQVSRELMYNWMNKYLRLGLQEPIHEKPFVPVPPKELSVYDAEHPVPSDALPAPRLRELMTAAADKQMQEVFPKDAASLARFRTMVGTALRSTIGGLPSRDGIAIHNGPIGSKIDGYDVHKAIFGRKGEGDRIPSLGLIPPDSGSVVAIWVHPRGKASLFENGKVVPEAKVLLDKKINIMAIDVLQVGEQTGSARAVDKKFAGYTFGYNRPLLAEQTRDIVTAVGLAKNVLGAKKVYLIGWGSMGPAAIMAKAICGNAIDKSAADMNQFRFDSITKTDDPMLLPGALKYGGLPAFAALCAPGELFLHNHAGTSSGKMTKAAYEAANALGKLKRTPEQATANEVAEWIAK